MAGSGSLNVNLGVEVDSAQAISDINKIFKEFKTGALDAKKAVGQIAEAIGEKSTTEIGINFNVDDRGLRSAEAVQREIYKQSEKVVREYGRQLDIEKQSIASLKGQLSQKVQILNNIRKYNQELSNSTGGVLTISNRWKQVNAEVKELSRQLKLASADNFLDRLGVDLNFKGLQKAGRGLTDIVNIFQSLQIVTGQIVAPINATLSSLSKLQSFALTFKTIGEGAQGAGIALNEANSIALGLGVSIDQTRESFQQLSPVILNSGGSLQDVSQITKALSSRFVVFGLSADKSRRVMNGVIQAFAKGKLQAEELTQQISEADPAFKVNLAEAIGVTVRQLDEMVKAGEVDTQMLLEKLPLLDKSAELFGKLGDSAQSAVEALNLGIPIEQVRQQLENINQISFETLARKVQPVAVELLKLQAIGIDLIKNFIESPTFDALTSVLRGLSQTLVGISVALKSVADVAIALLNPISALINSVNKFTEDLVGLSAVSAIVAVLLTGKLIQSFIGIGGVVKTVVKDVGGLLSKFLPLTTATRAQTAANTAEAASDKAVGAAAAQSASQQAAATAATQARTVASRNLAAALQAENAVQASNINGLKEYAQPSLFKTGEFADKVQFGDQLELDLASTGGALDKASKKGRALFPTFSKLAGSVDKATNSTKALGASFGQAFSSGVSKSINGISSGIGSLTTSLKGLLATPVSGFFGAISVATVAAAVGFAVYEASVKSSKRITEEASEAFDNYEDDLEKIGAASSSAAKSLEELTVEINKLVEEEPDFNAWEKLLNITAIIPGRIGTLDKINLNNAEGAVVALGDGAEKSAQAFSDVALAIRDLDPASDVTGKQTEKVKQQIKAYIDLKEAIKQSNREEIREQRKRLSKTQGAARKAIGDTILQFEADTKAIDEDIERVRKLAKTVGIQVSIGADETTIQGTLGAVDALKKELEERLSGLKIGSADFSEIQSQLKGIEVFKQNLGKDLVKLRFEVGISGLEKLAVIKQAQLDLNNAQVENIKAQGNLEQARFNQQLAKLDFKGRKEQTQAKQRLDNLEAEKKRLNEILNDENSSALAKQEAAQKLKEINSQIARANRDEAEREKRQIEERMRIEDRATKESLRSLAASNQAERLSLEIAQAKQRIEARIAIDKAKMAALEAERDRASLETLRVKAQYQGDTELLRSIDEQIQKQDQIIKKTYNIAEAEQVRIKYLEKQQGIERETLRLKQKASVIAAGSTESAQRIFESGDREFIETYNRTVKETSSSVDNQSRGWNDVSGSISTATGQLVEFNKELGKFQDKTIQVNIQATPSRFTGGPVSAGQTYQVNELGQESFLSSSGRLSMIKRPKNALWKPPSSGTVIPAHITAGLDIPSGGMKTSSRTASGAFRGASRASNPASIGRAILGALQSAGIIENNHNLAVTQAAQASQIGKLTQAVNRLVDKDWNVKVNVKQPGLSGYVDTINRML